MKLWIQAIAPAEHANHKRAIPPVFLFWTEINPLIQFSSKAGFYGVTIFHTIFLSRQKNPQLQNDLSDKYY